MQRKICIKVPDLKTVVSKAALGILYFLFLYSIQFSFVPGLLGTRVLIGMAGAALFLFKILPNFKQRKFKVSKGMFRVIVCLAMFGCLALFSSLSNGTSDRSLVSYTISIVMIILGAYFVVWSTIRTYGSVTFGLVSTYLIGIVVAQMLLSLLMFIQPPFRDLMVGLQYQTEMSLAIIHGSGGFRLVGFGSQFFAAGIANGFALLLIGAMFRENCPPISHRWLIVFFFLITFVGSMMARTTLVGAVMGLVLMFWDARIFKLVITRRVRTVLRILLVVGLLGTVGYSFLPGDTKIIMERAVEYGFEMFYNYAENGSLSTESTSELSDMYDVYPTNLKTWLIGDGFFADPDDSSAYYMGIDVGYLRLLFCVGLLGTIAYFTYQLSIILMLTHTMEKRYQVLTFFVFIYILFMNMKGFADITQYVALFMFVPVMNKCNASKNIS